MKGGPPPALRGRLKSLAAVFSSQTPPGARPHSNAMAKRAPARTGAPPRVFAVRAQIPTIGTEPRPPARSREGGMVAAIARYVGEREAKRALGLAGILPHEPFDGRPGDFTFVGRRQVDGHALHLLRAGTKIIVLAAQEPPTMLHSGDRVTLTADGRIVVNSQGRRR